MVSSEVELVTMLIVLLFLVVASVVTNAGVGDKLHGSSNKKLNVLMISDPTLSHLATLLAVGEELVHRGHNVTLLTIVSPDQQAAYKTHVEKYGVNLWNVSSKDLVPLHANRTNKDVSIAFVLKMLKVAMDFGASMGRIMANHTNSTLSTGNWDIVIGNNFMNVLLSCIQSVYKLPFVSVGLNLEIPLYSSPQWSWPGFPHGASSDNMLFIDRFLNIIYDFAYKALHHAIIHALGSQSFLTYCPSVSVYHSLSTVGHHIPDIRPTVMGFEYPLTTSPLTDYVGALVSNYPTPLMGELGEWLRNKSDRSVVYISTGSIFLPDEANGKAFLEGVMNANYSLLWSLRKSNQGILEGLAIDPDRVLISDWTPQLSVLRSKAIHSAILHGGFNGLSEALWNGVPVLVVPQMFEQLYNAGRVHFNGLGIHLDASTLSSSKITESLRALDSGEYRSKVSNLQKMFRMAGGVKRAADLVEFYEDVGYAHLVPAYAKYQWSWVQYYNADVYALMALILVIVTMSLITCCKCICRRCCLKTVKKKKKD